MDNLPSTNALNWLNILYITLGVIPNAGIRHKITLVSKPDKKMWNICSDCLQIFDSPKLTRTAHEVTTMLATSKNVLFPGHNH